MFVARKLTVLSCALVAVWPLVPCLSAEPDSPAGRWQSFSPEVKRAFIEGVLAGSRVSLGSFDCFNRAAVMGLSADPKWMADPIRQQAYAARIDWALKEGLTKGMQRASLSGKPEELATQLDQFYSEPRNEHIDPAWVVWLAKNGGLGDARKWASLKLPALRAYANVQWLNSMHKRDQVRPTFQWDRSVGNGPFGSAARPDGARETYFSLDPYCAAALLRIQDDVGRKTLRSEWGIARWNELSYRPLVEAYRRTCTSMMAKRDPAKGLVPSRLPRLLTAELKKHTGQAQPIHSLDDAGWAAEFVVALADDPPLRRASLDYLEAVWQHHWVPGRGLYDGVELASGKRLVPAVKITSYGRLGTTMAEVYRSTNDSKWRDRVLELNQLVWSRRRNPQRAYVPLFLDAENPQFSFNVEANIDTKHAGLSDDTDSIYYIRDVFRQYLLTGLPLLKEIVARHGRDYIEAAWLGDQIGHFTRHWWIDVRPLSRRMYGDGRFNSNYQMTMAAHLADTPKDKRDFLDFLDKQLATFRRLDGVAGLFGQQFLDGGQIVPEYGYGMDDWGLSQSQEQYLEILLSAYEASGERKYLDDARRHADRMLAVGPEYWNPRNAGFPAAAVRLARLLGPPRRVEIRLGSSGGTLVLVRDGRQVFKADVPSQFAVVYLPPGQYDAEITAAGQTRRQAIANGQ